MAQYNRDKTLIPSGVYILPHKQLPIFKLGFSENFETRVKGFNNSNNTDFARGFFCPTIKPKTFEQNFHLNPEFSKYHIKRVFSPQEINIVKTYGVDNLEEWFVMDVFDDCVDYAKKHSLNMIPTSDPKRALQLARDINYYEHLSEMIAFVSKIFMKLRDKKLQDKSKRAKLTTLYDVDGNVSMFRITLENFTFEQSTLHEIYETQQSHACEKLIHNSRGWNGVRIFGPLFDILLYSDTSDLKKELSEFSFSRGVATILEFDIKTDLRPDKKRLKQIFGDLMSLCKEDI